MHDVGERADAGAIRGLSREDGRRHDSPLIVSGCVETGTGRPVNTPRNCLSGPPTDAPLSLIENAFSSVECAIVRAFRIEMARSRCPSTSKYRKRITLSAMDETQSPV